MATYNQQLIEIKHRSRHHHILFNKMNSSFLEISRNHSTPFSVLKVHYTTLETAQTNVTIIKFPLTAEFLNRKITIMTSNQSSFISPSNAVV